ncbi:MAG: hypothetical protein U0736_12595 [Gemmataceae bacterium]
MCQINLNDVPKQADGRVEEQGLGAFVVDELEKEVGRWSKWVWMTRILRRVAYPVTALANVGAYVLSGSPLPTLGQKVASQPERFDRILGRWGRLLRGKVNALVLVIDEVSFGQNSSEAAVWRFSKRLMELHDWSQELPILGLVALPLPGWANRTSPTDQLGRNLSRDETLQAFSVLELGQLVDALCSRSGWKFSPEYHVRLHFLSGGIPNLVQKLGFESCHHYYKANPKQHDYVLEERHLDDAVKDNPVQVVVSGMLRNWEVIEPLPLSRDRLTANEMKGLLEGFYRVDVNTARTGLSEKDWLDNVKSNNSTPRFATACTHVWRQLQRIGAVVQTPDNHWAFAAEAIRLHLPTLSDAFGREGGPAA